MPKIFIINWTVVIAVRRPQIWRMQESRAKEVIYLRSFHVRLWSKLPPPNLWSAATVETAARYKGMPVLTLAESTNIQPNGQGRSQDFFLYRGEGNFGPKGRSPRPAKPKAGWRSWGRGSQPPPHQLGGLGEPVSSPSGVRGGAPAAIRFSRVLSVQSGLSRQFMLCL